MEKWRFIRSGACAPAWNMALDEAILTAHSEGKVPSTLRFYGWNPPTLSIGYFQKAEAEVNLAKLQQKGFGFVRRATGGRAVLHDRELTYSMVVSEDYPGLPSGVTEAYRVLSKGLQIGFRRLGLDAQMVQLRTENEKQEYASQGSAACFDSPSWHELVVAGRKVAGSAQIRQKGVLLQHGSILLELDSVQLFSLLKFSSDLLKYKLEKTFNQKAIAINPLREAQGMSSVSLETVEEAFLQGIMEGLNIEIEVAEPTPYELELAQQLVDEKYGLDAWNLKK